jgi:hypothetical protein
MVAFPQAGVASDAKTSARKRKKLQITARLGLEPDNTLPILYLPQPGWVRTLRFKKKASIERRRSVMPIAT